MVWLIYHSIPSPAGIGSRKLNLYRTRPEGSKLTPENTRNSKVAKLSPAKSRLKNIDRYTETMNSFWISLQTFQEYLLKVSERKLKLFRTSVETSKKFL